MTRDNAAPAEGSHSAADRLAHEIRRLRKQANLSQPQLAAQVGYSPQYVSLAERASKGLPSAALVKAIDAALNAQGDLIALREQAATRQLMLRPRRPATTTSPHTLSSSDPAFTTAGLAEITNARHGDDLMVMTPAGRFFAGSALRTRAYDVVDDGRLLASAPAGFADDHFMRQRRRGLVAGVAETAHGVDVYGLDTREARRRLAATTKESALVMSPAYLLDDLTLGVLWAVTNLDEPLLDDDALLAASGHHMSMYEQLPRSAAGRDIARDLAPVSQMWLGSTFCARHILRHAATLSDVPLFWTREQRGEEASTWLLFAHKLDYLRRTQDQFAGSTTAARIFCIPPSAVSSSSRPERILLLLAAALMESFGIRVEVCIEPEYTGIDGFVLDPSRQAIVANWVGADGIWQVDLTDSRPTLRLYTDVTGYARDHSIIAAPSPGKRLQALADYLDLNWAWTTRRCAELADAGSEGLAEPRSRLLSVAGVDRACQYLGQRTALSD